MGAFRVKRNARIGGKKTKTSRTAQNPGGGNNSGLGGGWLARCLRGVTTPPREELNLTVLEGEKWKAKRGGLNALREKNLKQKARMCTLPPLNEGGIPINKSLPS